MRGVRGLEWESDGKPYKEYKLVSLVRFVGNGPVKPELEKSLRTYMTPELLSPPRHATLTISDGAPIPNFYCFLASKLSKTEERRGGLRGKVRNERNH